MSIPRIVVGFVGPSGSGKSEAAKHLISRWSFHRVHTGLAMKRAVQLGFGLSLAQVDGNEIDRPAEALGGVIPRTLIEAVAHAIDETAPDAAGIYWRSVVDALPAQIDRIVADGIRSRGAADAVRAIGGRILRIDRSAAPADPEKPADLRQMAVAADAVIGNDLSLTELHQALDHEIGRYLNHVRHS